MGIFGAEDAEKIGARVFMIICEQVKSIRYAQDLALFGYLQKRAEEHFRELGRDYKTVDGNAILVKSYRVTAESLRRAYPAGMIR